MKLDLKKLAKIEKEYCENPVAVNSLQTMVDIVLHFNETTYRLAPNNVSLAITTLKGLGIIKETETPEVQQLNS